MVNWSNQIGRVLYNLNNGIFAKIVKVENGIVSSEMLIGNSKGRISSASTTDVQKWLESKQLTIMDYEKATILYGYKETSV